MISKNKIKEAIHELGLSNKEICIHSSMHSFGEDIECGLAGIVEAFRESGCTILVPAFSNMFLEKPIKKYMPERNGAGDYSYFLDHEYDETKIFSIQCKDISTESMGIFAKYVLDHSDSKRGNHPLNSFVALGKSAGRLVEGQNARDVYAPMKQLYEDRGYVLLMGVGLDRATIIHYAEQVAGRNLFIRWANDERGNVMPVSVGSCSLGFNKLYPVLKNYEKTITIGKSIWTCYQVRDIVDACANEIIKNPFITHCDNPDCDRCNDATAGGPVIDSSFYNGGMGSER